MPEDEAWPCERKRFPSAWRSPRKASTAALLIEEVVVPTELDDPESPPPTAARSFWRSAIRLWSFWAKVSVEAVLPESPEPEIDEA